MNFLVKFSIKSTENLNFFLTTKESFITFFGVCEVTKQSLLFRQRSNSMKLKSFSTSVYHIVKTSQRICSLNLQLFAEVVDECISHFVDVFFLILHHYLSAHQQPLPICWTFIVTPLVAEVLSIIHYRRQGQTPSSKRRDFGLEWVLGSSNINIYTHNLSMCLAWPEAL